MKRLTPLLVMAGSVLAFGQEANVGNTSNLTGLPPGGAAAGDLSGTYPNPTLDLTLAHAWTAIQTFNAQGIGTTPTTRIVLSNTTAAAAGAQQYSPGVDFAGNAWKTDATAASQEVRWRIYNKTVQGSDVPLTSLSFNYSLNGGAFFEILKLSRTAFDNIVEFVTWSQPAGNSQITFGGNDIIYNVSTGGLHKFNIGIQTPAINTTTNCSDGTASPADCAAAPAGSVVVAAAATSVVVNTTAVTANSQIFVMYDSSLGTKLSVTCNTTTPALYGVTARTAATSFTITATQPITDPACFSYFIVN